MKMIIISLLSRLSYMRNFVERDFHEYNSAKVISFAHTLRRDAIIFGQFPIALLVTALC